MSSPADLLQAHSEVVKLARLLARDPDQVKYLERLSVEDLRELRERVTETLYDAHGASLRRLAVASKLLPPAVSATIGEHAFGPLLSARLTGLLEPGRAVDVAGRLPLAFLADVAIELDPRRAREVISRIPPDRIAAITRELIRRGEYVTMGRFVGYLSDGSALAAVGEMDDNAVLRIAFVLEDKSNVGSLIAPLPERRVAGILRSAADQGLWVEALDLLTHVSDRQRGEIVAATLKLEPEALEAILAALIEHDLWQEALVIAGHDATLRRKLTERADSLHRSPL